MATAERRRRGIGPLVLAALCLSTGCVHGPAPHRPLDRPTAPSEVRCIDDEASPPRLQILVVYSGYRCNHAALRLTSPDRLPLFWDPGGHYGVGDRPIIRRRNLIIDEAPDIDRYTGYLWQNGGGLLEIFEWDIDVELAHELYAVLLGGTPPSHPAGEFSTPTPAFFCSTATSDFLRRFASRLLHVSDDHFFPHDLARELYANDPARVWFVPRRGIVERLGPPRASASGCP